MAERISNYKTLVSAVINVTEDDSDEFRAYVPTAIALAEDRISRTLDSQKFIVNTTISVDSSTRLYNKPNGYRLGHSMVFKTSSGERKNLRKREKSFCEDYWPFESSVAEPIYYADYDVSTFLVTPTPDIDSYVVFTHEAKPDYLSAGTSINYFIAQYPNAVFYATMAEMAKFSKQWDQVPLWDTNYVEAIQAANNEGRRSRDNSEESRKNTDTPLNTITGEN